MKGLNGYDLTRQWFEFVFETTDMITPIHTALYFWIIELNNRLQWKAVFGLPTDYSMQAVSVKTYKPYKKALDDLIRWGFVELKAKSYNQHTCNQIALVLKTKAKTKAEPKQRPKQKHHSKTIQTIQTIKTSEPDKPADLKTDFIDCIIQEFIKVFPDYVITMPGKEKSMAGKLLSIWKKSNPDLNSDEMLKSLKTHFEACKNIADGWYKTNMSLGLMVSKYNPISKILKNGNNRSDSNRRIEAHNSDWS